MSDKQVQKVAWTLRVIRDFDFVPKEYLKKLTNTNLWEVRIKFGNNIFRILGFIEEDNLIILTNGFQKKTQKTPKKEIEKAEKMMKDYLRRKRNG